MSYPLYPSSRISEQSMQAVYPAGSRPSRQKPPHGWPVGSLKCEVRRLEGRDARFFSFTLETWHLPLLFKLALFRTIGPRDPSAVPSRLGQIGFVSHDCPERRQYLRPCERRLLGAPWRANWLCLAQVDLRPYCQIGFVSSSLLCDQLTITPFLQSTCRDLRSMEIGFVWHSRAVPPVGHSFPSGADWLRFAQLSRAATVSPALPAGVSFALRGEQIGFVWRKSICVRAAKLALFCQASHASKSP
jgi:hypothetical protein